METFLQTIKEKTQTFTIEQKILFIALNCAKTLPNYQKFSEEEHFGDVAVLEKILRFFHQCIANRAINKDEATKLLLQLEAIAPDLDKFKSSSTSYALDACCAFDEGLLFLLHEKAIHLLNVNEWLYNTMDMYVQEKNNFDPNDKDLETKIANDINMIQEKARQILLLDTIKVTT
ncbi:MAG: hypothetical protein RLZZ292_1600 [Bacteroidota bacterium]|jgi:uncharacterized protein YjaG (DUF416 family)